MRKVLGSSKFAPVLVAVSALVLAAPALAQESPNDRTKSDDKLVCKRQAPTGTRFAKKTCQTRAERDKISEAHKRNAREMVEAPIAYQCRGPDC